MKSRLAFLAATVLGATIALEQAPVNTGWEVLSSWEKLPAGMTMGGASQVATNADGNILIFRRTVPPFLEFKPDGTFVKSWGEQYKLAHGIRVDRDGNIWVSDNSDNFIQKFSPDGTKLLLTIGKKGQAGNNESQDAFDGPADVFVAANGDFFVADGYR